MIERLFTWHGRIGRGEYLRNMLFILILFSIAVFTIDYKNTIGVLSALIVLLPMGICTNIKRAHDLDNAWYYILWLVVPGINLIALFYLCCVPGTNGKNEFGDNPAKKKHSR